MWTETGVWYDAEVLTINVNTRQAQLWYPSDEAEDEAVTEAAAEAAAELVCMVDSSNISCCVLAFLKACEL